ncbi:hypothetical protein CSPX01_03760 [Colletotrichum filicis]|nr:hypothetical protein CSPX01_03760 [Colletotrichum filicis]
MTAPANYCRVNRSSQEYHTGTLGLRKRSQSYSLVLSHLAVLLLGVIIGASVRKLVVSNTCPASNRTMSTPIPASVFTPTLPTVMTPDERFVGWNDAVNQNWLTILEGTGDGVWIPNAGDYGLAEGFQPPFNGEESGNATKRFYHISNQHQLHCLVRSVYHLEKVESWSRLQRLLCKEHS